MPDEPGSTRSGAAGAGAAVAATVPDLDSATDWVVHLDCTGHPPSDPWSAWVVEPVVDLLMRLDAAARTDRLPSSVTVVVSARAEATWTGAVSGAAAEAARGLTGSAALELGPRGVRANSVIVGSGATSADVGRVVSYLQDAQFTTASTTRLGVTGVAPPPLSTSPSPGRILITGAAGGIGAGVARHLATRGWDLVLSDLPGPDLDRTAADLDGIAVDCDVTDPQQIADLADSDAVAGQLRGLAILHGVGTPASIGQLDEQRVRRGLAINGTGVHDLLRALTPSLAAAAPSAAVVLSSQAGLAPEAHMSIYCAAKFAVVGLVGALAPVLAHDDVRIHALCPGPVDTPLMRQAFRGIASGEGITEQQYTQRRVEQIPARRLGTPSDMGQTASMLLGMATTGIVAAPTGGEVTT